MLKGHVFQMRLSEITALEENGFVPILIHVQAQGAASEVQKTNPKKKGICSFDDHSSLSLCFVTLFCLRAEKISYNQSERKWRMYVWHCHFSHEFMDFAHFKSK